MSANEISVLYIITKLELGGAQKVCLSLLHGVKESGIYAGLVTGREGVLVDKVSNLEDVYLIDDLRREFGFKTVFHEIMSFFKIVKTIKKIKNKYPNLIVHTHSTKAGIIGRWAAFFAGVKKRIHTIHGFGFNDYQSKVVWHIIFYIEYLTSLITTHFICVSEKDRELGVRKFPRFGQKSSIIRAAVEWDRFYMPALKRQDLFLSQNDSFIIGTISCFKPQKNLFDLLTAFKVLYLNLNEKNKQRVRLQIIGDGVLRPNIEEWIIQNNLSEKIDLLGWQTNVELWMKNWKAFAMSSLWEGLPIAVVEARLCKLPVVAYDVGGIFEVIFNGQNGFLVPPKNFIALSNFLKLLIEDKNLWKSLSEFKDEINDFNDCEMVNKHIQLYKNISRMSEIGS